MHDTEPDDVDVAKEQTQILQALALEKEHGEYRWSQIFKKDEVQTGRRILLAYGMQFINQVRIMIVETPSMVTDQTDRGDQPCRLLHYSSPASRCWT